MPPNGFHSPAVHEQGGIAHGALHRRALLRIVVGADPPLAVHEHQMRSVGDALGARMLRLLRHADSKPAGDSVADVAGRSGEKRPHPRAGAVRARVGGEPGGIVELGIHADRHQMEGRLEVPRAALDPRHLPRDGGASRLAAREDEARQPHATCELLRTEAATILRRELERWDRPEDRQPGRQGREERPRDRPRGDQADDDRPGQPGEPELGIPFTAALTFILVCTSLTNVLGWAAAAGGRRRQAAVLLGLTAFGGALFLVGQFQEWFGIWAPGLVHEGLVFGQSPRASTFFVITGYHGLHVLVGVAYILAILAGYLRGRVNERQIERLGLYWCFVDFVWVFVFSFVYLLPSLSAP